MRFPKILFASSILVIFSFLSTAAYAQSEKQRFALAIGNGSYAELGKLTNPANDAADMAVALRKLGFETQLLIDADLATMEDAVVSLGNRLSTSAGSTGFFYYAGHGVQSNGVNYLIPADARIASEAFLKTKALAAQSVLDTLQSARNSLNIIIMDACRDNPFGWSRSGTRGLSVVGSQPAGSILVYATSAGGVAQDGKGRNGVFTQELLKNLQTPGLEIKEVFNRTGADVRNVTGGKQIPAVYNQFFDSAYLSAPPPESAPTPSSPAGKPADLVVTASEIGAEVLVNGEPKGRAPLLVPGLPSGKIIHVEARTERSSGSLDLTLEPGEVREIRVALATLTGNLVIASNESDVRVRLDGKELGDLGSGVFRDIPVGVHRLELVGQDLFFGTSVSVQTGASAQVSAELRPVASLDIVVPLGVSAVVSGGGQTLTQQGPGLIGNLPAGSYTLSAGGGEWLSARETITLAKGQHFAWEPWKGGTVTFDIQPEGTKCLVEGTSNLDTSRLATDIAPGSYKAILRNPGYRDAEISFAVAIGKRTILSASLERLKPGIIRIAPLCVDLRLIVEGQTLGGRVDSDGSLRFEGVPAGYPLTIGFESPDATALLLPEASVKLAEGETILLELSSGRISLPWLGSDAKIAIHGKQLGIEGRGAWTSGYLPVGTYQVEIKGPYSYSTEVKVESGLVMELPGYREAAAVSLAKARRAAAADLAVRPIKTAAGLVSLAGGFLGIAGAGTTYFLVDQAAAAYRGAPDSASAAARWRDVESYQILLAASAATGAAGLVLSPVFLWGGFAGTTAAVASLTTGLLGLIGAGAAYVLVDQAVSAYRAAPDSSSAAARWKDVRRYQVFLGTGVAVGAAGLSLSPLLLAGRRDPGVLERSIEALDEGIRALEK